MKNRYTSFSLLLLAFLACGISYSQERTDVAQVETAEIDPSIDQFKKEMQPIHAELSDWDPVRGAWLANSFEAMALNQPVPDRYFPEPVTPSEMFQFVPRDRQTKINDHIASIRNNTATTTDARENRSNTGDKWTRVSNAFVSQDCKPLRGRSYGDPHFNTFDGKRYSLQSVGEFVYTKGNFGNFEVQTRQKASSQDFSLNIAVAMNVAGDRVAIYTNEFPDANIYEPVRLNGQVVRIQSSAYFLPRGGIIERSGRNYTVTWPTGEKVVATVRKSGRFDFMDITAQVYPCSNGGYVGLLGDGNGRANNDLHVRGNGDRLASIGFNDDFATVFSGRTTTTERDFQEYVARDFGESWRIDPMSSLFDYGPMQSNAYFTDRGFPRVFRTINDLPRNRRDRARRKCEEQGVSGEDLRGCVFDQAYLDLPAEHEPVISNRVEDINIRETISRPVTTGATTTGNGSVTRPSTSIEDNNAARTDARTERGEGEQVSPVTGREEVSPVKAEPVRTSPTKEERSGNGGFFGTKPTTTSPTRTTKPVRTSPVKTSPPKTRTKTPTRTSTPTKTSSPVKSSGGLSRGGRL